MTIICPYCLALHENRIIKIYDTTLENQKVQAHVFEKHSGARLLYLGDSMILYPRTESMFYPKIYRVVAANIENFLRTWVGKLVCELCLTYYINTRCFIEN